MNLTLLEPTFAICRLESDAAMPDWARGIFVSITRTPDELSVVCDQQYVPANIRAERDWRCLGVVGPLDFALTGVLLALAQPLAERGISIFAVSTFDTDYLLVKATSLPDAVVALHEAGHVVAS